MVVKSHAHQSANLELAAPSLISLATALMLIMTISRQCLFKMMHEFRVCRDAGYKK